MEAILSLYILEDDCNRSALQLRMALLVDCVELYAYSGSRLRFIVGTVEAKRGYLLRELGAHYGTIRPKGGVRHTLHQLLNLSTSVNSKGRGHGYNPWCWAIVVDITACPQGRLSSCSQTRRYP